MLTFRERKKGAAAPRKARLSRCTPWSRRHRNHWPLAALNRADRTIGGENLACL